MFRELPSLLTFSLGLLLVPGSVAASAWLQNGTRVASVSFGQASAKVASDGQGGVIIAWIENRSGLYSDVYAQRVDAWGRPVWAAGGVPVCVVNYDQLNPAVIADGAGGGIIVWEDARSSTDWDVYAQRVSADGTTMWAANGVAVCALPFNQLAPRLTRDAGNGAIITWHDVRNGSNWDIYAQRVNGAGVAQWTANGIVVCSESTDQFRPQIIGDMAGGAIVVWEHSTGFQFDVRAQRVLAYGITSWTSAGVVLCAQGSDQTSLRMVSDGFGGGIVVWKDDRTGAFNSSVFAQRVTSSGGVPWTVDGVDVCTAGFPETTAQIVSDGANGAVIAWLDGRAGGQVFAQRINLFGSLLWPAAGVNVSNSAAQTLEPRAATDGVGGAVVSWIDFRYDPFGDTFLRRVDANGVVVGPAGGSPIALVPGYQTNAEIATDGAGGAIMTWTDGREIDYVNAYAQRYDRFGNWGYPSADIVAVDDVPGDQGGHVNVAWDASRFDPWPYETIDRYTVWRAIDPSLAASLTSAGASVVSLDRLDPAATQAIRVEDIAGTAYYWQLMSTVDAYHLTGYATTVPTLFDSTASSPDLHHFQVIAHGLAPQEYWPSAPAGGRSIDNLAPAAPLMLSAQRTGSDVLLTWNPSGANEADFLEYAVYRASISGVQPVAGFFLSGAEDTTLVDAGPPGGYLYYIVTARDTHGNQSTPSNEASVAVPTAVGDAPSVTRLVLASNVPNPFTRTTELRVGLPRASDVRLEVYDVAGRRVAIRSVLRLPAGWQRVGFDGRDQRGRPLPSGVYFGRVSAAGETRTTKMVIQR